MHAPITELVDFDRKFASDNPHFISHTHPAPPPADKPDKEGSCLSPGSNTTGLDVGNHSHGPTLPRSCLQTTRQVAAIVGKGIVETHYCTLDGAKGCHQRRCPFHRAMNQVRSELLIPALLAEDLLRFQLLFNRAHAAHGGRWLDIPPSSHAISGELFPM